MTYSCLPNLTCGCSVKLASVTKIIGGEDARKNTWGWAVSLRIRNSHICGGSLISSVLVVTAAHCVGSVKTLSSLTVTAGSNYLSVINQQRSVLQVFIPYNYNSTTYSNDIAIIQVSSPFDMTDHALSLICLPPSIDSSNDTTVVAIGWGILSEEDKMTSNTLQQVTLKIIVNAISTCYTSIHDENTQLCAGVEGGGKDTCQGDSGGPLMMFYNERWYLIGITSYGNGCASPYFPGVYTRVSIYTEYIGCFLRNKTSCIKRKFIVRNTASSIISFCYMNHFSSILFFCIYSFFVLIKNINCW